MITNSSAHKHAETQPSYATHGHVIPPRWMDCWGACSRDRHNFWSLPQSLNWTLTGAKNRTKKMIQPKRVNVCVGK